MNWYLQVLKKYADFSGRARRKEFWIFTLITNIIEIALFVIGLNAFDTTVLYGIFMLATLIPSIAVTVRRLHDIGKSGVWYFISCVPIIGTLWMLAFLCTEGQSESNAYGENPKA